MSLSGKVAFITGGAMGFGYAFAETLGREGASVVIAEINMEGADLAARRLQDQGIRAIALPCDVSDEEAAIIQIKENEHSENHRRVWWNRYFDKQCGIAFDEVQLALYHPCSCGRSGAV